MSRDYSGSSILVALFWKDPAMDEPKESSPTNGDPLSQKAENVSPAPPSSLAERVRTLFVGREGLRLIWRFVLYLAMAIGIAFLLGDLLHYVQSGISRLWVSMLAEIQLLTAAVVPALIMARIEKRPFGAYGLPPRCAFGKLFWLGMIWGLVA